MTLPNETMDSAVLAQADACLLIRDMLLAPAGLAPWPVSPGVDCLTAVLNAAGLDDAPALSRKLHQVLDAAAEHPDPVAEAHCALFEGGTPCPVNETAYIRRDKGVLLADIAGFYMAFGFEPTALGEKLDHLAVELEFIAVLLIQETRAVADEDREAQATTQRALSAFADDHLGQWVPMFWDRLAATAAMPWYETIAELLVALWSTVSTAHGLAAPDALTPLDEADDPAADRDDGPYECGMAATVPLTANHKPLRH